ncbi:MAG: hypothetical protein ABI612_01110 [Betaproteobacteria bacterium]
MIQRRDDEYKRAGKAGIGAIGVLGTDPYDKLTILQALREQLPDKTFFTMNLDARFLHPEESAWARNVIVVSGFGLQLHRCWQGDIPPLRDGYQTAAFFATQWLIRDISKDETRAAMNPCSGVVGMNQSCPIARKLPSIQPPLLFEIGRTRAVRLSESDVHPSASGGNDCSRLIADAVSAHPPAGYAFTPISTRVANWLVPPAALCAALLFAFIVAPAATGTSSVPSKTEQSTLQRALSFMTERRRLVGFLLAALCTAGILVWDDLAKLLTSGGTGEPAFFLEGISVWPAELIRVVVVSMAVVLLWWSHRSLKDNADTLGKSFRTDLPTVGTPSDLGRSDTHALLSPRALTARRGDPATDPHAAPVPRAAELAAPTQVPDTWTIYCSQGSTKQRVKRVAVYAVLYFLFSFFLFLIWPADAPARGDFAFLADKAIMRMCAFAFTVLLGYVVDALLLCNRCIGSLVERPVQWSGETLAIYEPQLGLAKMHVQEWITIQAIADRTQAVGRLIYWPFAILFLIILARNSLFERWSTPPSVVLSIGISAAIVIYAAIKLRRTTEAMRSAYMDRLNSARLIARGSGDAALAGQLDLLIDQSKTLKRGAFAPYSDQPFIRAMLLPLAGFASSALIEYVSLVNP